jgi:molybdate transport system substrate-binding protein
MHALLPQIADAASRWTALVLVVAGLLAGLANAASGAEARADSSRLLVFAAASQKDALDEIVAEYVANDGPGTARIRVSYQSSSALARQIEQGAPADLYVSANPLWMDYLAERDLVVTDSRVDIASNRLVLVAPQDSPLAATEITAELPIAEMLGKRRLAIGDPDHVPVGVYGRQALTSFGLWPAVENRLARADNTRAALALVARGEVALGIVYASDAAADPSVRVIAKFPQSSHDPIVYPAAVVKASPHRRAAQEFLTFLAGARAAAVFERFGFTAPRR